MSEAKKTAFRCQHALTLSLSDPHTLTLCHTVTCRYNMNEAEKTAFRRYYALRWWERDGGFAGDVNAAEIQVRVTTVF